MDARPHTIREIFGSDECLIVPIFQRPYVWKEDRNWEPLWNDVASMVTLFADDDDANPHFLGAVVLDHLKATKGSIPSRQVVDGQQRLTTLQVLLAAVRDAFTTRGVPDRYINALRQLTRNQDELSTDRHARFKVWPTLTDRGPFSTIIVADTQHQIDELLTDSDSDSALLDAYRYFFRRALQWLEEFVGSEAQDSAANSLVNVLRDGLQLVVINLSQHDNAQVIFESLNDRGTPLLPSDLIKNLLFQLAESYGHDPETLYNLYWQPLESKAWKSEIRQGRLNRSRLDAFFAHYLTMRLGKEILAPALFTQFRTFTATLSRERIPDLMSEIKRFSRIYENLTESKGESSDETLFLSRLSVLDTTVITPVLLFLFDSYPSHERSPALQLLESWLVRRMISRLTSKNYNRMMLELLHLLKRQTEPPTTTIREYLLNQSAESGFWPTDEAVQDVLLTQPIYRQLTRARIRLVLGGCNRALAPTEESATSDLAIEYLLAPNLRDAPDEILDTLGNLTLLPKKLGTTASTASWEKRRSLILETTPSGVNQLLPLDFGPQQILQRSVRLADSFCKEWPHPLSIPVPVSAPSSRPTPTDRPRRTPPSPPQVDIASHVNEVFGSMPIGTVLTSVQIASLPSAFFGLGQLRTDHVESGLRLLPGYLNIIERNPLTIEKIYVAALAKESQPPDPAIKRKHYTETIQILLSQGLLQPDDELVYREPKKNLVHRARVRHDGAIFAGGREFSSVSAALTHSVGRSANGWEWTVIRTNLTLSDMRIQAQAPKFSS